MLCGNELLVHELSSGLTCEGMTCTCPLIKVTCEGMTSCTCTITMLAW